MNKKKKTEETKCNCQEDKEMSCQDNCHCEPECTCQEECTCGTECNCEESCECGDECCCHVEENIVEELNLKVKELQEALLRSHAELQNYRKRKDEETAKIIKYAEEDILKGFLPILDNFERAIDMDNKNFGDETSKFLEGFRMVYTQTKALLEKFEVKEIDCLGQEFDPTYEQAITTVKREDKKSGIVTEVYQKGYMYKDRILRTAMVIVNE